MPELQTPVVLILFNRPALTRQVFAAIRAARPARLFLIADGPRPGYTEDPALCAEARAVVAQVDWPCRVETDFATTNLGCGLRIALGLDRVFQQVEEAIILEDDILPDPSFFPYCQALLADFRHAPQVMGIGGRNDLGQWQPETGSYFFHRCPAIWGWATWRRAWQRFDFTMARYSSWDVEGLLATHLADPEHAALKAALFRRHGGIPPDTWDIQWAIACLVLGGLWISPTINLVANLGFDAAATHTIQTDDLRRLIPTGILELPLRHPAGSTPGDPAAIADVRFDRWIFLLQLVNSYKDLRKLRIWQRALAQNPELQLPGLFPGGRHTLAPLLHPEEVRAVLAWIARLAPDDARLAELLAALPAGAPTPGAVAP